MRFWTRIFNRELSEAINVRDSYWRGWDAGFASGLEMGRRRVCVNCGAWQATSESKVEAISEQMRKGSQ